MKCSISVATHNIAPKSTIKGKTVTHKIVLNDAFKRFTLDQDKIISPEDTVKHFKEKLRKVNMDILAAAAEINRDIQSSVIDSYGIFKDVHIHLS